MRFNNSNDISLESYWDLVNDLGVSTIPTSTEINGYAAQRIDEMSNEAQFPSPRTDAHIKAGNKIFGFSIQNVNGNFEFQIELFNQMLSTFQFTQ